MTSFLNPRFAPQGEQAPAPAAEIPAAPAPAPALPPASDGFAVAAPPQGASAPPAAPAGASIDKLRVGQLVETAFGPGVVLELVQPGEQRDTDGRDNYPVGGARVGLFASSSHLPVPLQDLALIVL